MATTGVFTIPLMKKTGYKPAFAGAVEAVSSTGGQILPPVMGAIAFVMAEWIGVPYSQIVIAALVPALLYFFIVFISVHLQASKNGLSSIPFKELPNLLHVISKGWFYLLPLVALVYFLLVKEYPPAMAGIYSFPILIASSFLSKDRANWLTPKNIMHAFERGIIGWLIVAVITATIGIMVGAMELSGIGIKISNFILDISGGSLILTLILVGITSLILGMGLDSIPAYITLATLVAPALIMLGVPDILAHLYVIYWGLSSFITPPVCTAVFVACGISGAKIWETGWEAVRLGIAAYIIPIAFILSPGLALMGTGQEILIAVVTATIGAALLATGIRGYSFTDMNVLQRVFVIIGSLLVIGPGYTFLLIGISLVAITYIWQFIQWKNKTTNVDFKQNA